MLDQFMNIVREASQDQIVNNPQIPNEYNQEVMQEAGNSVLSAMQSMMASGQGANLLGLFGSGGGGDLNNNPLTQMATNNFTNNVSQKLGLNPTLVKAIAAIVIPMLIKKFLSRTNANPANAGISNGQPGGIDIQDIFNTISGGGTSGLNLPNILSRFTQRQQQNPATCLLYTSPSPRD